jgi:transketolase
MDDNKDLLIISKGHIAPLLYAIYKKKGILSDDDINSLRKFGSKCQGHPDKKFLNEIVVSTGSLGMGLSIANGIALARKYDNNPGQIYVLMGDGEVQEGMVWESAMTSSHYKLKNVTVIIDKNGLQIDGCCADVKDVDPLGAKWEAFGWDVLEINGHDYDELEKAFSKEPADKPIAIIGKTIKGKGVSYMENNPDFHGKAPTQEEFEQAMKELGGE